jgi:HlyD family type I secretion membrane fusion protein
MSDSREQKTNQSSVALPKARARFLNQAIQLEESNSSRLGSIATILSLGLIISGITWAAITNVNEMAHARGTVVPEGLNHAVQHLDGGLVKHLPVRNGTRVSEGDLLVRFDHSTVTSQLEQARVRKAALELQAERLSALVDSRELRPLPVAEQYPHLADKQRTIYRAQKASHAAELQLASSQIAQRDSEIEQQLDTVDALNQEVSLLKEQVQIRNKLTGGRLIAKTEVLAIRSQLAESQSDLRRAQSGVNVARSAREEARQRSIKIAASFYKELQLQAGEIANQTAEVFQEITRLQDSLRRAELYAPIDGLVPGLTVTRDNAVVNPGQVIMEIVPVANTMLVEARLSPSDIGHVRIGQTVDVKIDSYDSSKFGIIDGKVESISAYTYLDDRSQPYYRSEISLANPFLEHNTDKLRIIPGMTVVADITTGSKTLLDYLLKPINRGLQSSFTER